MQPSGASKTCRPPVEVICYVPDAPSWHLSKALLKNSTSQAAPGAIYSSGQNEHQRIHPGDPVCPACTSTKQPSNLQGPSQTPPKDMPAQVRSPTHLAHQVGAAAAGRGGIVWGDRRAEPLPCREDQAYRVLCPRVLHGGGGVFRGRLAYHHAGGRGGCCRLQCSRCVSPQQHGCSCCQAWRQQHRVLRALIFSPQTPHGWRCV